MTLPEPHAHWFARFYAARVRSWTYLTATTGQAIGLTLVLAPFLVLFLSPILPAALVSPVRIGPSVWLGLLLGMASGGVQSAATRRIGRRLGAHPAGLGTKVTPLTLLPYALARGALDRRAAAKARRSDAPVQGWISTGLWLYGRALAVVVVASLVVGVLSGRLQFS